MSVVRHLFLVYVLPRRVFSLTDVFSLSEFDFPVLILNIFITDSHFPEILIITDPHFQESAEVSRVVYFILYLCINISFQLIQYVYDKKTNVQSRPAEASSSSTKPNSPELRIVISVCLFKK